MSGSIITRFGGDTSEFDRELAKVVSKTKDASRNIDQSMTQTAEKVGKVGNLLKFGSTLAAASGITTFLSSISNHAQDMVDAAEAAGQRIDESTRSVAAFGAGVNRLKVDFVELGVTAVSVFTRIGEAYGTAFAKVWGMGPRRQQADNLGDPQLIRDALAAGNGADARRIADQQLAALDEIERATRARNVRGTRAMEQKAEDIQRIGLRRGLIEGLFLVDGKRREKEAEAQDQSEQQRQARAAEAINRIQEAELRNRETIEARRNRLIAEAAEARRRAEMGGLDSERAAQEYGRLDAEILRLTEQMADEEKRRADEAERAAAAAEREARAKGVALPAASSVGQPDELATSSEPAPRRAGMRDIRAEMAAAGVAQRARFAEMASGQRARFADMAAEFRSRFEIGSDPRAFEPSAARADDRAVQHLAAIDDKMSTLKAAIEDL